jgi:hypothetical protein
MDSRIFHTFDNNNLARFLGIFDCRTDMHIDTTAGLLQSSDEFGFKNARHKRIRGLSRANPETEPVVAKVRQTDVFDGSQRNVVLGGDAQLTID